MYALPLAFGFSFFGLNTLVVAVLNFEKREVESLIKEIQDGLIVLWGDESVTFFYILLIVKYIKKFWRCLSMKSRGFDQ